MKHVEQNYTAIRHTINKVIEIPVFDESKVCQIGGVTQTVSAKLTAAMNIKMETSGQVTLIGNLGDLRSFKQSHLTFRNKGFITALIDFQAKGELRFGSLNNEIAGKLIYETRLGGWLPVAHCGISRSCPPGRLCRDSRNRDNGPPVQAHWRAPGRAECACVSDLFLLHGGSCRTEHY